MTLEEAKNLKTGDLVKLKSNNIRLIVDKVEDNFITCVIWDEVNLKLKNVDNIDYAFLTKIE